MGNTPRPAYHNATVRVRARFVYFNGFVITTPSLSLSAFGIISFDMSRFLTDTFGVYIPTIQIPQDLLLRGVDNSCKIFLGIF